MSRSDTERFRDVLECIEAIDRAEATVRRYPGDPDVAKVARTAWPIGAAAAQQRRVTAEVWLVAAVCDESCAPVRSRVQDTKDRISVGPTSG